MSFDEFCEKISKIWWGENVPLEVPEHIFCLFVAGYEAKMSVDQFWSFLQARSFASSVVVASEMNKVSFARGNKVLKCYQEKMEVKEAITTVFDQSEVKQGNKHLFST